MIPFCDMSLNGRALVNGLKKHELDNTPINDGDIDFMFEKNISNKSFLHTVKADLYRNIHRFMNRIYITDPSDSVDASIYDIVLLLSRFFNQDYVQYIFEKMYTEGYGIIDHALQVALTSLHLSIKHKVPISMSFNITIGSLFCDIGMISVFDKYPELSYANRNYTPEEYDLIKNHPIEGFELLSEYGDIPNEVKKIVLLHHVWENHNDETIDRFNRSYPYSYNDIKINKRLKDLSTNIVQMSDQFNSIIMNDRMSTVELVNFMKSNVNIIYNISAKTLLQYISPLAIGDLHTLYNKTNALLLDSVIIESFTSDIMRPTVKTLNGMSIDLSDSKYANYFV